MFAETQQSERSRVPVMKLVPNSDRRKYRRRNFSGRELSLEQIDSATNRATQLGQLLDMSISGLRFKTNGTELAVGSRLQVRLTLPSFTGISPFIDRDGQPAPTSQWTGWITVTRIISRIDGTTDIAGQMLGLDETDRGMLGLYLSTQPLAA